MGLQPKKESHIRQRKRVGPKAKQKSPLGQCVEGGGEVEKFATTRTYITEGRPKKGLHAEVYLGERRERSEFGRKVGGRHEARKITTNKNVQETLGKIS